MRAHDGGSRGPGAEMKTGVQEGRREEPAHESVLFEYLLEWWLLFHRRRVGFILIMLVCAACGLAYGLLAEKQYKATVRLLPTSDLGARSQMIAQLSALTGIADLPRATSFGPLYPDIAQSRIVISAALDGMHEGVTFRKLLSGHDSLTVADEELLYERLKRRLGGFVNPKTGLIVLELTLPERELVAPLLNEILAQMDLFFQTRLVTEARQQRLSIERRLAEVSESLQVAEENLERFLTANRSPGVSPALQTAVGRLRREVEINSSVYVELKRQHEITRIEEIGTVPPLRILSEATRPLRQASPRRALALVLAILVGFLCACIYIRYAEVATNYRDVR